MSEDRLKSGVSRVNMSSRQDRRLPLIFEEETQMQSVETGESRLLETEGALLERESIEAVNVKV
jgi:hypothetical protein